MPPLRTRSNATAALLGNPLISETPSKSSITDNEPTVPVEACVTIAPHDGEDAKNNERAQPTEKADKDIKTNVADDTRYKYQDESAAVNQNASEYEKGRVKKS